MLSDEPGGATMSSTSCATVVISNKDIKINKHQRDWEMELDRRNDCKLNTESFAAGIASNHEFITWGIVCQVSTTLECVQ